MLPRTWNQTKDLSLLFPLFHKRDSFFDLHSLPPVVSLQTRKIHFTIFFHKLCSPLYSPLYSPLLYILQLQLFYTFFLSLPFPFFTDFRLDCFFVYVLRLFLGCFFSCLVWFPMLLVVYVSTCEKKTNTSLGWQPNITHKLTGSIGNWHSRTSSQHIYNEAKLILFLMFAFFPYFLSCECFVYSLTWSPFHFVRSLFVCFLNSPHFFPPRTCSCSHQIFYIAQRSVSLHNFLNSHSLSPSSSFSLFLSDQTRAKLRSAQFILRSFFYSDLVKRRQKKKKHHNKKYLKKLFSH